MRNLLGVIVSFLPACHPLETMTVPSRPLEIGDLPSGDPAHGDAAAGDPVVGDAVVGDPGHGDEVGGDPSGDSAGDSPHGDAVAGDPAVGDPAGDPGAGDSAGDAPGDPAPSYEWQTSNWETCTAYCNGGTESRTVWCVDGDGTTVSNSLCPPPVPDEEQPCNTQACSTCTISTGEMQDTACDGATVASDHDATADCFNWCKTTAQNLGWNNRTVCCNHVPGWQECRLYNHGDTVSTVGRVAVLLTCN